MILKLVVCCVVFILVVNFFGKSQALDASDDGACVVKISDRRSLGGGVMILCRPELQARVRPEWESRNPECIWVTIPANNSYLNWTNRTICCQGWQHNSELDTCAPVCSTGCANGKCIAPSTCHCEPPLYLDPERLNACLTPTCDPQCVNSICSINNICECDTNARRYNKTHCAYCDEHYDINADLTCQPTCEPMCIYGECTAPNTCSCLNGYIASNDVFTCVPVCDKCVNSTCIAPNECSCLEGYSYIDETTCTPKCEACSNGICVAPGQCECLDGYSDVNGTCEAVCDMECVNGFCSAPNVCACNEGYVARNRGVCSKPCRPECNGTCDLEGQCSAGLCTTVIESPRVINVPCRRNPKAMCTKTTYKKITQSVCCYGWNHIKKEDKCEPRCKFGCTDGKCVAPDVCECELPRTLIGHACVTPTCDPPCVSGSCVGTNSCRCIPGYHFHNATHCIPSCLPGYFNNPVECAPRCSMTCYNGICAAPETCSCLPGYVYESDTQCVPTCDPGCPVNARCSAPETCSCLPGYVYESNTHCVPKCDPGCHVNARCSAPDTCECLDGYQSPTAFPRSSDVCEPICNPECSNGKCTAPNTCSCDPGYSLNATDRFHCFPICEPECVNASCDLPNTCSCLTGYEPKDNLTSSTCKPICDRCENGECVAPNNCRCHDGYAKVGGKCSPVCAEPCLHGDCTAPNVCSCHDGYTHQSSDPFICEPVCSPDCVNATCVSPNECRCLRGYKATTESFACRPFCSHCENGECIAPGECRCNAGFSEVKGKCVPICTETCQNGDCIAPDVCSCHNGYVSTLNKFKCQPVCTPQCENATCVSPNVCQCLAGYESTGDSFVCKPTCASCINGACVAPNECECLAGYAKDIERCSPVCTKSCVNGFCTVPDHCECFAGYKKNDTNFHVCYKHCDGPCENGHCTMHGECSCKSGYKIDENGTSCLALEPVPCGDCNGTCYNDTCWCADKKQMCYLLNTSEQITTTTGLAGLELSWIFGGAVGLLLIILLIVTMQRMWTHNKRANKTPDDGAYGGSVIHYTAPDTLLHKVPEATEIQEDYYEEVASEEDQRAVNEKLLCDGTRIVVEDEQV